MGTHDELFATEVVVAGLNWLGFQPVPGTEVEAQLRHRAPPVRATVEEISEQVTLRLHEPRPAVTPGQSAVLFDGARVVGGGRILHSGRPAER